MKAPTVPINKWTVIGYVCVVLAVFRLTSDGGWELAALLVALGVLNFVIGIRQPPPPPRDESEEEDKIAWAELLVGSGLLFVLSGGLVLLISGSLAAALLMGVLFTAPLLTIGASRKRRGDTPT